jgi:MATE family multidrug resistance protein
MREPEGHGRTAMTLWNESKLTLRLALPLMIGQLSQMLLGVADTVMIGRLGVTELAALTFASALFHVPFVFGIGVLTGVSVVSANAFGAGDSSGARASCRHGLKLGLLTGAVLAALGWLVSGHLGLFGQPPEVVERSPVFFRILMLSLIPALASIALKNHADALQRPWPPFWIFLGGVLLNIALNWVMIYGKLGCPRLGLEGAAWATLIARTVILVVVFGWLNRATSLAEWVPRRWWRAPTMVTTRRVLAIGVPASAQMFFEVTAFSVAALLVGRFGATAMAAHQVALTIASLSFMVPLGMAMALTVRIGEANGAGERRRFRPITVSGWLLCSLYALLAATVMIGFGEPIAAAFSKDAGVISLAAMLLAIVGIFQVADGLQVASCSMLRGLHDARVPALMGFASYWVIGLPAAALLAFHTPLGPRGVWWGLALGLVTAACTMGPRLWRRIGRVGLTQDPSADEPAAGQARR